MAEIILDDIPNLIKQGVLTQSQAGMQIYLTLYLNPARFNLLDLNEDERSDFLLSILQTRIDTLIKHYNPKICPFGAYIYNSIQKMKLTFYRKRSMNTNFDRFFIQNSIYEYQARMERGYNSTAKVADQNSTCSPNSTNKTKAEQITNTTKTCPKKTTVEKEDKKEQKEIPQLVYKRIFKSTPYRISIAATNKQKFERGMILLALKSAWYISEEQIDKISTLCNVPRETLNSSICSLKANLINRALCRKSIESRRNRAYSFFNNYKMQLEGKIKYDNPVYFEKIQKKHDFHKQSWEEKTKTLQSRKFKIAPSNKEVGDLIGISNRLVSCYIKKLESINLSDFNLEDLK